MTSRSKETLTKSKSMLPHYPGTPCYFAWFDDCLRDHPGPIENHASRNGSPTSFVQSAGRFVSLIVLLVKCFHSHRRTLYFKTPARHNRQPSPYPLPFSPYLCLNKENSSPFSSK